MPVPDVQCRKLQQTDIGKTSKKLNLGPKTIHLTNFAQNMNFP